MVSITSNNRPGASNGPPPHRAKSINELSSLKSRSRENIARYNDDGNGNAASPESSFHVARPATVISNASLSSASTDVNNSGRSER